MIDVAPVEEQLEEQRRRAAELREAQEVEQFTTPMPTPQELAAGPGSAPDVDELQGILGNGAVARAYEAPRPAVEVEQPSPESLQPPPPAPAPPLAPAAVEPEPTTVEPAPPQPEPPPPERASEPEPVPAEPQAAAGAPAEMRGPETPGSPLPEPKQPPEGAEPGAEPAAAAAPEPAAAPEAQSPPVTPTATDTAAAPAAPPVPEPLPPPPALPADASPKQIVDSLAETPLSAAADAYAEAQAASGAALERQRTAAQETLPELPAPTGLPPAGAAPPQAELPAAETPKSPLDAAPAGPAKPADTTPVPEAPPVPVTPTVLAGGDVTEEKPTDEELARSATAALNRVELPSEEVPSSLGPRPNVDVSGEADPARLEPAQADSTAQVSAQKAASAMLIDQDFGENAIWPQPTDAVLSASAQLSPAQTPSGPAVAPPMADPEVARGLDASVGPVFQQRVAEQTSQYDAGEMRYRDDSAAAHDKAREDIADLESQARAEQTAAQQEAKAEVLTQRGEWRKELDATEQQFVTDSTAAKQDHLKQVQDEKRKGEENAAKEYEKAEKQAADERAEADRKAEAEKKKKREDSGGFWGWAKRAARALVDALKAAINFIYDNLRKLVKGIFELAKKLALAAIELARKAIVGLIKAFGEVLKGLVSIALAAFPEIAERINKKIDAAVDKAVDVVNKAAEWLGKAVSAILDFLSSTIDQLLGLIQSIYNGILTVIGMIISGEFAELIRRIGYLIDAAKLVPDTFETAALEELLGGDLDKPLSPAELAAANMPAPGVEGSAPPTRLDATALPQAPWDEHNVGVDRVATGFELSPELAADVQEHTGESGTYEFAATEDATRSMDAVVAEASGKTEDVESEKFPDDGLTARGRAEVKWKLMKEGIAKWWSENWGKVLLAAAAAILGFIALNIVTGGAISAAIPAIMGVLGPLFVGLTVLKLLDYVREYVEKAWSGDVRGGGKALSHALAAGAIELIMYLTFKVGEAAVKGGAAVVKGVVRGGAKLAKGALQIISKGLKWILEKGKILFRGIAESGLGRRLSKLKELGEQLLEHLRFRKFRIRFSSGWFVLEGFINPWIVIAEGEIKIVKKGTKEAKFVSDEQLDAVRKGVEPHSGPLKTGEVGTYKDLKKTGVVGDKITPDHIPSRAALVENYLNKLKAAGRKIPPASIAEKRALAAELERINEEGITIATKAKIHKAGRTFGGKNIALYATDAKDLATATRKDIEAIFDALHARGQLTPQVVGSYLKLYNANVARKVFGYTKELDGMFMKYLALAKKL